MNVEDLLKSAGAELPDDVRTKLIEGITAAGAADTALEVTGLKKNNTDLLEEKRESARLADEAKVIADSALEEKLKAEGKTGELNKFYTDRDKKQIEDLSQAMADLKSANNSRDLANTRSKFGDKFLYDADLYLSKMVTIGEDGKSTFKDIKGNIIADSEDSFATWLDEAESMKHVIKGPGATGGGSGGSGGSGGAPSNKDFLSMSVKEKAKYLKDK